MIVLKNKLLTGYRAQSLWPLKP